MNKILTVFTFLIFSSMLVMAQLSEVGYYNTSILDPADSSRPFQQSVNHIRTADIAYDMDKDGKNEIIATDYSNGGRVHVFELQDNGILELVWSSPADYDRANASTPRWVRSGDLDGDGNAEIIFSVAPRYEGEVLVFEHKGGDNDYGTEPIIDFPATLHTSIGLGAYRMDREQGWVYDFDGDGKDELIMANQDNKVYILSINGNAPGFASWQLEGGDPNVHPNNGFSGGSWWHSIPCDYDGDGTMEIVNHYWNFYGFWSIEPTGADSYTYPSAAENPGGGVTGPIYFEYTNSMGEDAVSFMGINALDVDGDGNQELSGNFWVGTSTHNYDIALVDVGGAEATGVEVWNSQDQFAILKDSLWVELGLENGEYWGNGAADLNGNGRDEILIGGVPGTKLTALEYTGSGSIMDGDNYEATLYDLFETLPSGFEHRDSAGVQWVDTSYVATQYFIAKMATGDFTGNEKPNIVLAYQTVPDSLENTVYSFVDTSWVQDEDATFNTFNPNAINLRVFEYDGTVGLKPLDLKFVTPDDYALEQNYPNPFNPTTSIRFSLPMDKEISLVVYDMLGREVKTLISNQEFQSGSYEFTWDATNSLGSKVVSGNYIATLKFGNFTKSIKMMLLK